MTNISGLNDREKSVLLAKAMGWDVYQSPAGFSYFEVPQMAGLTCDNLYAPANMHVAWRVLRWICRKNESDDRVFLMFNERLFWWDLFRTEPVKAQRAWLDSALWVAIEMGIIELEPSKKDKEKNAGFPSGSLMDMWGGDILMNKAPGVV